SCSTRRARSPQPGTLRTCARAWTSPGKPWTAAPRPRDSTSWWHSRGTMGTFADALARPGLAAIAEVKRRPPSAGGLRPDADPAVLAPAFAHAGAAAISILVDERFGGSFDDLCAAR